MDVRLSTEQDALSESVARVVAQLGPKAVGQLDDTERAAKLDAAVEASGWRELRSPDEHGTPLASGVEVAIVAGQLARGLADTPFLGPVLAAELRRLTATQPVATRETVAFAADLAALGTDVVVDSTGAELALGLDGERVVELTVGAPVTSVDLTRPMAAVGDEPARVVGAITPDDRARVAALGTAIACADLVGVMSGAVALARDYATERRQYGVPVGSFQAVQHMLADALVASEGSHSVTLHAAWAVDALAPDDAHAAAALAKAYCARSARAVCETAIQVHGGIGNTWECMAHVHLRRALLSTDLFGGVGPSLGRVLAHHGIGGADGLR